MDSPNPYLLLGVDYGADAATARRSFARAARRIRRAGGDAAVSIEDLNRALHEIQQRDDDPADAVDQFRVPANPGVFQPGRTGMFAPAPRPLARRTEVGESDVDVVEGWLADDLWELLGAVTPRLTRFDDGYPR
ncbi:hypothetical protein ACWEIJ_23235 [Lentzea sp. NPDC004789]